MFQRPKFGETEDDILKQQEEFFKGSEKESLFKRKATENEDRKVAKKLEVLSDIIERKTFKTNECAWEPQLDPCEGFPKPFLVDHLLAQRKKGKKSLFAMQLGKSKTNDVNPGNVEIKTNSEQRMQSEFKKTRGITMLDIHEENVKIMSNMSEKEILEERRKLINHLDPSIVSFFQNKKGNDVEGKKENNKFDTKIQEANEEEVKKNIKTYIDSKWINMDFIEKEKLEWIGEIPDKKSLEPDQPYSARFDFKGELQPFLAEIDVRTSLYHHGEEPNRPGYTIQELYQLSRSQILQQRVLALNTLANIMRKTKLGYYDRCFDGQLLHKLVESDLFFLLRFSIDDNPLIPAAVNCLHNLICNESDEFCLDKLLGISNVDEQPLLSCKTEAKTEEENELKDHVIISHDMIKGIIRTDLVVRLAYILNTFAHNRETVVRIINCLIRTSRHSLEAAQKVLQTKYLMTHVYSKIKSNQPIHEGVKLFRVICSHSKEITVQVLNSFDFHFLVSFVEAEENANISKKEFYLLKLESLYFWKQFLLHDLYLSDFVMWSPSLVRLLLFYTQKVDVTDSNDFDFELFTAITCLIIICNKKKVLLEPNIIVTMQICLEKWLTQLIQQKKYSYAVSKALGAIFRYFTSYFRSFGLSTIDLDFVKKVSHLLVLLIQSQVFVEMSSSLRKHSHLLNVTVISRDPVNLPSLCSVYDGGEEFLKIVHNSSSLPFFISLGKYLKFVYSVSHDVLFVVTLFFKCPEIQKYLTKVKQRQIKRFNWFMKYETYLLSNIVSLLELVEARNALDLGFKLVPSMRVDDKSCRKMFKVIFSKRHWDGCELNCDLSSLYCKLLLEEPSGFGVKSYAGDLLGQDWLFKVFTKLRGKEAVADVCCILNFICFVLKKVPYYLINTPYTFRFYHLCVVFLTDSNVFDSSIQRNLEQVFVDLVCNKEKINLNFKFEKKKSFYDLYTELITQYAGISYGLPIFGEFVLFPLQNRFDVSFRKLIWFEYLHVLRVITLGYPLPGFLSVSDFVRPCETDESLLVAYLNSVSNGVISKKRNPFVYFLAIGNLKMFLDSENQDEKLLGFLRKKVAEIRDEELVNDFMNFNV